MHHHCCCGKVAALPVEPADALREVELRLEVVVEHCPLHPIEGLALDFDHLQASSLFLPNLA